MNVAIYVSVYALIIVWLSIKVIKNRLCYKVSVGDGGVEALQIAMGAQSNAVEYLPISVLLLLALELNGANVWLIHFFGITMVAGRYFHYKGMLGKRLPQRVLGMKITLYGLLGLAMANLAYLPYSKMF
jgi:uncharacterized membrane protein YecN with MAPEG domain